VFTLLTRGRLFEPMESKENNASEVDVLLYQMVTICGENFKESFIRRCARTLDYFRLDCALLF
jgi:serine/threonine-protein kinase SRPK3